MFKAVIDKIVGDSNQRYLKKIAPQVDKINKIEKEYQLLTQEQLVAKTDEFKKRLQDGQTVDDLICEAYATVKNACRRLCGTEVEYMGTCEQWNMIPYDVQLVGGLVIHQGGIAEMQTGEGKTLTASMPLYLNALTGRNVQLVTVNDYLALRDSQWIGTIFRYLGLSVGCIQSSMSSEERRENYACDITYGTNSEFGFDYLRDMGMTTDKDQLVQRDHYFCIVDEIDSILIDEARTPLIISGPVDKSTHMFDKLVDKVAYLHKLQIKLCQNLIEQVKQTFDKELNPKSEAFSQAIKNLYLVKLGNPKNKHLATLLENVVIRRALDKYDLRIHSELNRGLLQKEKEKLYFSIDEKYHDADLSEKGRKELDKSGTNEFVLGDIVALMQEVEEDESLSLDQKQEQKDQIQRDYDQINEKIHNVSQLLRAYGLYEKDVQYIVSEGRVIIVDEHTGRAMPGRRFGDGLHQAIEAKEKVAIEDETQTLATITIQNYFRLYDKLGGMTGTAETEKEEFLEIYGLDVIIIPTNKPSQRTDLNDKIYKTSEGKYKAIIAEIIQRHNKGQPILVGTPTVEVSEYISHLLGKEKVSHQVLNARRNKEEAQIVAQAGQKTAVTIATNMAGRGTDIKLGEGVAKLGGLHVIGATRHDSRRIDRQLRGRCARQGDEGSTIFYISLEDDLMRLYGADRITGILERLGYKDDEALEANLLTRTISKAQKRVETQHYSIRKRTLQYDDVINEQRRIIYGLRKEILFSQEPRNKIKDIVYNSVEAKVREIFVIPDKPEEHLARVGAWVNNVLPFTVGFAELNLNQQDDEQQVIKQVFNFIWQRYEQKEASDDEEIRIWLQQHTLLTALDEEWKKHLLAMDHLRQNVSMVSVAQKDPLVEYKQQAFKLFDSLTARIADKVIHNMFMSLILVKEIEQQLHKADDKALLSSSGEQEQKPPKTVVRKLPKVGRNELCPCGSGKKYKNCCG